MAAVRSGAFWRILGGLPLALVSPLLLLLAALGLALTDLFARLAPRPKPNREVQPDVASAAIVIPNWNGRDLLEKYLASVIAAAERVCGRPIATKLTPRRPGDPAILIGKTDRAKALLGWNPARSDLELQVRDAWNWFRVHRRPAGIS